MKTEQKCRECPDCIQGRGQKIPCSACDGLGTIDYTKPVFAVWGQNTTQRIVQENA
jgi:DnaJ-class molecular chaperone